MKITIHNYSTTPLFNKPHGSIWRVLSLQGYREQRVAKAYSRFLDTLECQSATQNSIILNLENVYRIGNQLSHNIASSSEKTSLKHRVIALKSRVGIAQLYAPTMSIDRLKELAQEWKTSREVLDVRELTQKDLDNLDEVHRNVEFMQMLEDEDFRSKFFDWTLRFQLSSYVFVGFPHLCGKLIEANMHHTLSADQNRLLNLHHTDQGLDVTLQFDGNQHISLLDDTQQITFPSGNSMTVGEMFQNFKDRSIKVTTLRYFPALDYLSEEESLHRGVCEWHTVDDSIKIAKQGGDYWKNLPPYKRISVEEATRYSGVPCDGTNWVVGAAATRSSVKPILTGNHTHVIIFIPSDDGTYYDLYPIGKFPDKYPKNFLDTLKTLFLPFGATLVYPDDNPEYLDREHICQGISCDAMKGREVMEWVRKDWLTSYKRHVFMFVTHNCATWVKELIEDNFPDNPLVTALDVELKEIEPEGPIGLLFKAFRKYPSLEPKIIKTLGYMFGGYVTKKENRAHGKRKISLLNTTRSHIQASHGLFKRAHASAAI